MPKRFSHDGLLQTVVFEAPAWRSAVPACRYGDYPVIAGAVSGSANQPKNDAESDRCLKRDTKSGTSGIGGNDARTQGPRWRPFRYHRSVVSCPFPVLAGPGPLVESKGRTRRGRYHRLGVVRSIFTLPSRLVHRYIGQAALGRKLRWHRQIQFWPIENSLREW